MRVIALLLALGFFSAYLPGCVYHEDDHRWHWRHDDHHDHDDHDHDWH